MERIGHCLLFSCPLGFQSVGAQTQSGILKQHWIKFVNNLKPPLDNTIVTWGLWIICDKLIGYISPDRHYLCTDKYNRCKINFHS